MKKNSISIFISFSIMVIGTLLPSIGPVSDRGVSAIALVLAMVLLLAAQALPIGVMCFLCILAQPLMRITESLSESASYWANYLFFFVVMAFNIGLAFSNTTLPRRVLLFMLEHVKKDARGPVLAIWLTTALLSGIIANFAVIALMLAFAWEYLSLFDDPVKKKKNRTLPASGNVRFHGAGRKYHSSGKQHQYHGD